MGVARAIGRGFQRAGQFFASLENPAVPLSDPDEWTYEALGGGGESDAGVRINQRTVLGYPPVWRGINLLADGIKKTPLRVYKRQPNNGKERAPQHPGYKVIRKPNELMTEGIFKQLMTFHTILHGNGFAYIEHNGRGEPTRLLTLDPLFTAPINEIRGDYKQLWYVTRIGNEFARLRPEEVLHLRRLSHDGINGFSLLYIMRHALGLGMAARKFGSHFFKHGSNQAGILMVPQHFKKEAIDNLLRSWDRMATGLAAAHKVSLLQDGAKFVPTSITPEQGQFLQTRQFEVREVANILGLPPHKLGDSSRLAYNSLEQENASYLDESLDPWLVMWEEECNEKLLTEEEKSADSTYFEFNRNAIVRIDAKSRSERSARLVGSGLMTINEGRLEDGLPTLGPDGDVRYRPVNWVEIGNEPPPKAPKPKPPAEDDEDSTLSPQDALRLEREKVQSELIRSVAARAVKIECEEARAAAARDGNFLDWVDRFYPAQEGRMASRMIPVAAAGLIFRTRLPQEAVRNAEATIRQWCKVHCDAHRSELISAAEVPAAELAASVERVVSGWDDDLPLFLFGDQYHAAA